MQNGTVKEYTINIKNKDSEYFYSKKSFNNRLKVIDKNSISDTFVKHWIYVDGVRSEDGEIFPIK